MEARARCSTRAPGLPARRAHPAGRLPHDPRRGRAARARGGRRPFKQFMREAIEDGRRAFKSRRRARCCAGPLPLRRLHRGTLRGQGAAAEARPARPVMHGAYEVRSTRDGVLPPTCAAPRPGAGTPSTAPRGAAGHAVDPVHPDADLQRQDQRRRLLRDRAELPAGQLGEPRRRRLLLLRSPGCPVHDLHGLPAGALARAAGRGYIEEILGTYTVPGNVAQGGGSTSTAALRLHELRDRSPGQGAKYVLDGARLRRRRVQPRGRHGRHRDVGAGQAR